MLKRQQLNKNRLSSFGAFPIALESNSLVTKQKWGVEGYRTEVRRQQIEWNARLTARGNTGNKMLRIKIENYTNTHSVNLLLFANFRLFFLYLWNACRFPFHLCAKLKQRDPLNRSFFRIGIHPMEHTGLVYRRRKKSKESKINSNEVKKKKREEDEETIITTKNEANSNLNCV